MKKYQKPSLQIVSLTSESEIAAGGFFGKGDGEIEVGSAAPDGLGGWIADVQIKSFGPES